MQTLIQAAPYLKHFCGGAAWLLPHSGDLRVHRSTSFCLHHVGVWSIDDDADDGGPELLCGVKDEDRPGTERIKFTSLLHC